MSLEPIYATELHHDFRFGKWWVCEQPGCDMVHHYYVESGAPV